MISIVRELAEFYIKSITPVGIGGSNPAEFDERTVLGTSFRGIFRWWLRSIVGGVIYDAYCISNGDIKKYTKIVETCIFGGAGRSSLITTLIENIGITQLSSTDVQSIIFEDKKGRAYAKNIRLALLIMGKSKNNAVRYIREAFRKEMELKITVYSNAKSAGSSLHINERISIPIVLLETLALYAMAISVALTGVGKGARRALGALMLNKLTIKDPKIRKISENKKLLEFESKKLSMSPNIITDLIEEARNIAKEAIDLLEIAKTKCSQKNLPPFPVLSRNYCRIYIKHISRGDPVNRLVKIDSILRKLFLRSFDRPKSLQWRSQGLVGILQNLRPKHKNTKKRKIIVTETTRIGSYILGLPRGASKPLTRHNWGVCFNPNKGKIRWISLQKCPKAKVEDKSGYAKPITDKNDKNEECISNLEDYRRASPLIVSFLNENTLAISFFKSSDWPPELCWWTTYKRDIDILIVDKALNSVESFLNNKFKQIWP